MYPVYYVRKALKKPIRNIMNSIVSLCYLDHPIGDGVHICQDNLWPGFQSQLQLTDRGLEIELEGLLHIRW